MRLPPRYIGVCLYFLMLFSLLGCRVTPSLPSHQHQEALTHLLASLDESIPPQEAYALSRDIFLYTARLTERFALVRPPWFHNTLVNLGLRQKGLCYHWSDALYLHLHEGEYPHFDFLLSGANIGSYWFEHNSVVVVAKGHSFEEGVVLDPWRNSGELFFSKVTEDKAYHWVHRSEREPF